MTIKSKQEVEVFMRELAIKGVIVYIKDDKLICRHQSDVMDLELARRIKEFKDSIIFYTPRVTPIVVTRLPRGTDQQTEAFYRLIKAICTGKDVPENHILRKLRLCPRSVGRRNNAWGVVPELRSEVGNWEHALKQIYTAYTNGNIGGARLAIAYMCIYGDDLRDLVTRYPEDAHCFDASVMPVHDRMAVQHDDGLESEDWTA